MTVDCLASDPLWAERSDIKLSSGMNCQAVYARASPRDIRVRRGTIGDTYYST